MIERLAEGLVSWQIKCNYIPLEEQNLYRYGFELLIAQAVNLLIACFLAIIFHEYLTISIFLLSFIPLRSFSGGHHADNYQVCTALSTLMLCVACAMVKIIPDEMIFAADLLFCGLCGISVFVFAPVGTDNKPLDEKEKRRYGKCSRIIWGIEAVAWIICYGAQAKRESLGVTLGHLAVFVLLHVGIMKNKKLKK